MHWGKLVVVRKQEMTGNATYVPDRMWTVRQGRLLNIFNPLFILFCFKWKQHVTFIDFSNAFICANTLFSIKLMWLYTQIDHTKKSALPTLHALS